MLTKCHLSMLAYKQAKKYGNRDAFIYKDFGGKEWKSVSWRKTATIVRQTSNAMLAIGIQPQENIAIFSQNSLYYAITDFAAWGVRAVTIPFYATSSEEQIQFMVNDARIRYIFVGEQEQYDKARRLFGLCPCLERIIVFSSKVRISTHDPHTIYFADFLKQGEGLPYDEELNERLRQANGDDLMSILYTSGTTGNSKGVMLSHAQAAAAIEANDKVLTVGEKDKVLNFLPFTHIFEKGWALLCVAEGATLIILTNPKEVQEAMRETHPTCMSSVPRFWEKVYSAIQVEIDSASPAKKKLFNHALKVGHAYNIEYLSKGHRPPLTLALEYKLIDKTVFALIRKELGITHPHIFPTAGAAVSDEVAEFIHSIGIFMMVGYGLTESFATASNMHYGEPFTIGSIGIPLPGLDVKISEEGEILLKGPTITRGYYNRPDLNTQCFTPDGYFRTGDVGYIKDGELYMTERIKDLYKTSNGKYIAPQMIESKILVDKFVEQMVVIADQRKFVSALIVPNYSVLEDYARRNGISFNDREQLCANPQINQMIGERIDTLQQSLANYEKVKRFTLMPHHFSLENGEITNTLKVKRNVITRNYKQVIDNMYKE